MFSSLQQKFKRLPAKDRKQLIILIACIIISAYGFFAALLWHDMFKAEKMANRKANRIETRIGKIEEPTFNSAISDKNLVKLQTELASSTEAISKLTSKFIPFNNADRLQTLKLDISELADDVNVKIKNFEVLGAKLKAHEEELAEYNDNRNQYYKRPYFSIEAESRFYPLLAFIQELSQLDNIAIVQKITIVRGEQNKLIITMKILV
ncbi:MAG: hypothetical protein COB45_10205 [Gammaproteobacteria bacterium]|nr:MAG: hypothetical protein COB45_10205 [Gammaproteobacteria bacterium]PHR84002.1 MAG: hypothetical protein COA59_08620 [Colwellia sp.]